jgi:hypothetical protein
LFMPPTSPPPAPSPVGGERSPYSIVGGRSSPARTKGDADSRSPPMCRPSGSPVLPGASPLELPWHDPTFLAVARSSPSMIRTLGAGGWGEGRTTGGKWSLGRRRAEKRKGGRGRRACSSHLAVKSSLQVSNRAPGTSNRATMTQPGARLDLARVDRSTPDPASEEAAVGGCAESTGATFAPG